MAEEEGITVRKSENFSDWYTQVVLKAELADYGLVQGTIAIRPNALKIWENIQKIFDERIKELGHENAYFPLLIPESLLRKEAEHFKGFVPEVFWVFYSGDTKLGERLAIRPTSETIINNFFSKWIRSWRDLPIKLNQWCNILRAEIKSTKPFVRTSEFLWQEGHTAHATHEEAEKEMLQILEEYRKLIEDYLAIPVLVGKKTESEKFAGAETTTTVEALMPDGKALQMGTSHNLGQNFAKPFGIKYLDKNGKENLVYTTSWGISTRLIGGLIMTHGDDKGLVLPPKIAPVQIVIIPIFYNIKQKQKIFKECEKIVESLQTVGLSVKIDSREEYSPGWKFNHWEMKGVPIRIEIGPKDLQKKQVVVVRRDIGVKNVVKRNTLQKKIPILLDNIQKNLFSQAKRFLQDNTTTVKNYEELKKVLESKGGFIRAPWCGSSHCEEQIKIDTGATIRVLSLKVEKTSGKCVYCGKAGKEIAYFAKAY